jgi:predicted ATP-dependent protease
MTLVGYLGGRYAGEMPLSLSAQLTFEQSYGGIEGDSASSTELYALLSSLSGIPIRQGVAVTGSVNQAGEIQAIGGVTQKVEGWFNVCREYGLTGDQGVMIPAANVQDLMLRVAVVKAVEEEQFHIWAVENVDQGLEVLTGRPAPEVHKAVHERLEELAEALEKYDNGDDD